MQPKGMCKARQVRTVRLCWTHEALTAAAPAMPWAPDLARQPAATALCCTALPTAAADALSADGVVLMARRDPYRASWLVRHTVSLLPIWPLYAPAAL